MNCSPRFAPLWAIAFAGLTSVAAAAEPAADAESVDSPAIEIEIDGLPQLPHVDLGKLLGQQGLRGRTTVIGEGGAALTPSSHWIGVAVRPVEAVYQQHLKIEGGLLVDAVTPKSPAAKAEVKPGDILLAFGDAKVDSMQGLMDLLSKNKDTEAKLTILRPGKKRALEIVPEERPAEHAGLFLPEGAQRILPFGDAQELQKFLEKSWKGPGGAAAKDGWHWQYVHPGVVLGGKADVDVEVGDGKEFPDGMMIMMMREGDGPARIKVQRGKDSWEVTETQLDKLPEDIRELVKKYIDKSQTRLRGDATSKGPGVWLHRPQTATIRALPLDGARLRIDSSLDKKLEEINGRLEKIEKALEKLAEQR